MRTIRCFCSGGLYIKATRATLHANLCFENFKVFGMLILRQVSYNEDSHATPKPNNHLASGQHISLTFSMASSSPEPPTTLQRSGPAAPRTNTPAPFSSLLLSGASCGHWRRESPGSPHKRQRLQSEGAASASSEHMSHRTNHSTPWSLLSPQTLPLGGWCPRSHTCLATVQVWHSSAGQP